MFCEKHKIAMSNRRDGNDRPRGRGSGSKPSNHVILYVLTHAIKEENRQKRDESHDKYRRHLQFPLANWIFAPSSQMKTSSSLISNEVL